MKRIASLLLLVAMASPAAAHLPSGDSGSLTAGLLHPLLGADHVLAMLVVGLWASRLGRRALWAVPAAFVSAMLAGFGLALLGMPLPGVEPMILASTVVLGLVVALALRLGLWGSALLVGFFALFHGHAHGAELGEAAALRFAGGFALATLSLHLLGVAAGQTLFRSFPRGYLIARGLGGMAALAGAALAFG